MYKVRALSYALGLSFLSAVADRFGFWGAAGETGVAWGNYDAFLIYTKHLNSWAPEFLVSTLGSIVTILEIILAMCLIVGFKRRYAAFASYGLLSIFSLSMIIADGLKGPFDYGVLSAAMGSLLLAEFIKVTSNDKSV